MTVMFRQRYNCLSSLNENRRIEVKHRNKNNKKTIKTKE